MSIGVRQRGMCKRDVRLEGALRDAGPWRAGGRLIDRSRLPLVHPRDLLAPGPCRAQEEGELTVLVALWRRLLCFR